MAREEPCFSRELGGWFHIVCRRKCREFPVARRPQTCASGSAEWLQDLAQSKPGNLASPADAVSRRVRLSAPASLLGSSNKVCRPLPPNPRTSSSLCRPPFPATWGRRRNQCLGRGAPDRGLGSTARQARAPIRPRKLLLAKRDVRRQCGL